jgi:two-component system, chemotaxis family, chemotaxis protein CheY
MQLNALVVDDSDFMRKVVMKMLVQTKLADFSFIEAIDGMDALEKLSANEIDVAFIDWNMPNMTGIEFIKEVRTREKSSYADPIPLIMITSEKTMRKMVEALNEAGADCFISKPFNASELKSKIVKHVERAELRKSRAPAAAASH